MSQENHQENKLQPDGIGTRFKTVLARIRTVFTEKPALQLQREAHNLLRSLALGAPVLALAAILIFAQDTYAQIPYIDSGAVTHADGGVKTETETITVQPEDSSNLQITNTVELSELQANYQELPITSRTQLFLDSDQVPIAINILSPESPDIHYTRYLSQQEITHFTDSKMMAEVTQEPWLVPVTIPDPFTVQTTWDIANQGLVEPNNAQGIEVPQSVEVLTTDALAAWGVRIHSDESIPMKLHIRPNVFQEKGFMQALGIINTSIFTDTKTTLDIVLVNSLFIHSSQLTAAQQEVLPPEVLSRMDNLTDLELLTQFRESQRQIYNHDISQLSTDLSQLPQNDESATTDRRELLKRKLIIAKRDLSLFNSLSDSEVYYFFPNSIYKLHSTVNSAGRAIGLHIGLEDTNNSYVFISVGESTLQERLSTQFWYTSDGQLMGQLSNPYDISDVDEMNRYELTIPQSSKSYPNPSDLITNPTADRNKGYRGEYLGINDTFAQVLEHEVMHATLIKWIPLIQRYDAENNTNHLQQLQWFMDLFTEIVPSGIEFPDQNETDTDKQTINLIRQAYKALLADNPIDLYPFVFTTPPNKHDHMRRFMIAEQVQKLAEVFKKINSQKKM